MKLSKLYYSWRYEGKEDGELFLDFVYLILDEFIEAVYQMAWEKTGVLYDIC